MLIINVFYVSRTLESFAQIIPSTPCSLYERSLLCSYVVITHMIRSTFTIQDYYNIHTAWLLDLLSCSHFVHVNSQQEERLHCQSSARQTCFFSFYFFQSLFRFPCVVVLSCPHQSLKH